MTMKEVEGNRGFQKDCKDWDTVKYLWIERRGGRRTTDVVPTMMTALCFYNISLRNLPIWVKHARKAAGSA